MRTVKLPQDEWTKILAFLRTCSGIRIGKVATCRRFVEGVLWMARSGAQWRLLPAEYGNWNAVYKRFARWCELGIWEQMHAHFANDPDMESLGASKKTADRPPRPSDAAGVGSAPKSM
jgi:transposase